MEAAVGGHSCDPHTAPAALEKSQAGWLLLEDTLLFQVLGCDLAAPVTQRIRGRSLDCPSKLQLQQC